MWVRKLIAANINNVFYKLKTKVQSFHSLTPEKVSFRYGLLPQSISIHPYFFLTPSEGKNHLLLSVRGNPTSPLVIPLLLFQPPLVFLLSFSPSSLSIGFSFRHANDFWCQTMPAPKCEKIFGHPGFSSFLGIFEVESFYVQMSILVTLGWFFCLILLPQDGNRG